MSDDLVPFVIMVTPEQYEAFVAALDAAPRDDEKLRRLLDRAAPWDKEL